MEISDQLPDAHEPEVELIFDQSLMGGYYCRVRCTHGERRDLLVRNWSPESTRPLSTCRAC